MAMDLIPLLQRKARPRIASPMPTKRRSFLRIVHVNIVFSSRFMLLTPHEAIAHRDIRIFLM